MKNSKGIAMPDLRQRMKLFLSLFCFYLLIAFRASAGDLGNGFFDHGVASPNSNQRGIVATTDGNGRNVVLVWLFDHRGTYALQMIDAGTGKSEQFIVPFDPNKDAVYCSFLSSKNRLYTLFANHFLEFDPAKRAFTFCKESKPQMTPGMTEDDNGVIWAATYPRCGVVSFNPATRGFKDYGYVYDQNWRMYPVSMAADDSGWIYIGIGITSSQLLAFNPATGKAKTVLNEADRKRGYGFVYRDVNGKVYGKALKDNKEDGWYELYKGIALNIGTHPTVKAKPYITGSQGLFHRDFPDGKRIKELDLINRRLTVETHGGASRLPHGGASQTTGSSHGGASEQTVRFDYASEGAWVMGIAAAPDGTIAGGTTFPMRFFNYNPKTDKFVDREAFGQFDALACQGDRFYFGVYPSGTLLEWDPSKPWINTKTGEETNPKVIAASSLMTHRPHRVLAYPDGKTIIMTGTPEYGYTGGGLVFWDRQKKSSLVLKDSSIITDQSTFSIAALPKGKFIGGTTTQPGTGGIRKATEAELYIMDLKSKKVMWHGVVFPGVQEYSDLYVGPDGLVYGITDRKRFFVFDPVKHSVVNQQEVPESFGTTVAKESLRVFIKGPNKETFMLFKNGIAQVEPGSYKLSMKAQSPVPILAGGDYLDGRIWFISGSHLCSYKL